jgi:nucleotide-binding universal stress UspA family protein
MKILSTTDLLPKSEIALERAAFLADSLDAELTIVHAVSPDGSDGRTLEQRVRRADSRLAARTASPHWRWESQPSIAVQCGRPANVVLDNAYRQRADLVVLGPHLDNVLADALSGTITEKVLGAAACPVLIARTTRGPYHDVLMALDGMPNGGAVIRAVEALGLTRDSRVHVVHAHEPPYVGMMNIVGVGIEAAAAYAESSRAQARAAIAELVATHSADPGRYEVMVVEHRPAAAILEVAGSLKPDLVVLGTRGHGRVRRALLGSVASEVLKGTGCDVLLVPERAGEATSTMRKPAHERTALRGAQV